MEDKEKVIELTKESYDRIAGKSKIVAIEFLFPPVYSG